MFGEIPFPGALGVSVVLVVATFCWCWREWCRRESIKQIERQRHEQRVELLREYGRLLSAGELAVDDLPLITRMEKIEPPAKIEPPGAIREADL
jgi:hypothetical protein